MALLISAAVVVAIGGTVAGLTLSGGGGQGTKETAARGDATATAPATAPATTASGAPAVIGSCSGNTLVVPGDNPAAPFDPILISDMKTSEYAVEIFSGLVRLDTGLKAQPDIAKSWDVSPDGKMYTFHLRDDAVFDNGRPVTAEDFKYSFERAANPANHSPTVLAYLGEITGLKARFEGKAESVSGVKAVDAHTLQITLGEPDEAFIYELTYPVAFVVDREQVTSDAEWTQHPNGTGPFELAEYTPLKEIRLARNPRYYLGPPKLNGVVFKLDGGPLLASYQQGELDVGVLPAIDLPAVKSGTSPLRRVMTQLTQ